MLRGSSFIWILFIFSSCVSPGGVKRVLNRVNLQNQKEQVQKDFDVFFQKKGTDLFIERIDFFQDTLQIVFFPPETNSIRQNMEQDEDLYSYLGHRLKQNKQTYFYFREQIFDQKWYDQVRIETDFFHQFLDSVKGRKLSESAFFTSSINKNKLKALSNFIGSVEQVQYIGRTFNSGLEISSKSTIVSGINFLNPIYGDRYLVELNKHYFLSIELKPESDCYRISLVDLIPPDEISDN